MKFRPFASASFALFLTGIAMAGFTGCAQNASPPEASKSVPFSAATPAGAQRNRLQHRRGSQTASSTEASPSTPSLASFYGNLTVLNAAAPQGIALVRQPDCSLLFAAFDYTLTSQTANITVNSMIPGYEKTLHSNAFLTTTPDVFSKGCVDTNVGYGPRFVENLGLAKNGQHIVAAFDQSEIIWAGMNSNGTISQPSTLPVDIGPATILNGDLNKDGNQDLITINTNGAQASIGVYLGTNAGGFQPEAVIPLPEEETGFAIINDMDGDGNLDLVVGVGSGTTFEFLIYLGKGDGTFAAPVIYSPNQADLSFFSTFISADVNGDGHPDLITSEGQVFLGQASGTTFTYAGLAFTPANDATNMYAPGMLAADFNNDGKLDLATDDGRTIRTYLGNGDGTFTLGPAYATLPNRGFIVSTDLDGDGNVDIFSGFGNSGAFGGDDYIPNQAYALLGNGDGTFAGAPNLPVSYAGTNLGDLNGDGRPDLVAFSLNSNNQGVLTSYITQSNGIPTQAKQLMLPTGQTGGTPVLGKFTGGSTEDVFWVGSTPIGLNFNVSVGNGDGSFQLPTTTNAPSLVPSGQDISEDIQGVQAVDVNHDGKADLVYWFYDIDGATDTYYEGFAVQLGNGDGTFQAPKTTLKYNSTTQLFDESMTQIAAIADVNKDNFPDVFVVIPGAIVQGTQQNTLELFVSKGDGTFQSPTTLTLTGNILPSASGYGSPLAFGDLNGDGNVDIVASGSSSDGTTPTFAVALGNGDGTFKPATLFTVEGFGYAGGPALADFTGDDKLDLVLPGAVEGSGGIFPGNGDGTFQSVSNTDGTISPTQQILLSLGYNAVAADFNNDGKLDLLFGSVLLLNKSGATPPSTAPTNTSLASLLNPSTVGASVTFTATVTSSTAGTITGTVNFLDGATQIGTGTLNSSGVATFPTTALTQGTHSITAQYGGDSNYSGSTSTAVSQVVNASAGTAATTTMLTSSPNPSTVGAGVSFTATVTSTTPGTISGSISFYDGAKPLDTPITMTGNIATYVDMNLAQGTHTITAHYNGNANYAGSTSQAVSQVVNAASTFPTMTTLSPSTTNAVSGTNITFTATVALSVVASKKAQAAPAVTGTVTFYDGSTQLGTGAVGTGGVATYATSTLAVGSHSITAQYGGDANYGASTSMAAQVTITASSGSYTLTANPASLTVTPSTPATTTITVAPSGGFNQAVALACSGLPSGFNCTFGPPTVTPNGAPATSTLTITDGEPPSGSRRAAAMLPLASGSPRGGFGVGGRGRFYAFAFIGELALLGLAFARRKRAIAYGGGRAALAALVFAMAITFMAGCSGGPGTQVVSVTVTGTAGTQSASTTISATLPK